MNTQLLTLETLAEEAADFIKTLGNPHRLLVLCLLVEMGELNVGQIHQHSSLSQSALSQHIAIMREEGLISYRREAQTLYYRIADDRVFKIVSVLKQIFCP
ncbi:MAG: metalloregulator ArsR/SmtB family transcription factor [Alcaligenaceae bacterium]|nr:metalloregulator ArsR/SmtB family transcription factor [Alcaligenaceae bacterium]